MAKENEETLYMGISDEIEVATSAFDEKTILEVKVTIALLF